VQNQQKTSQKPPDSDRSQILPSRKPHKINSLPDLENPEI